MATDIAFEIASNMTSKKASFEMSAAKAGDISSLSVEELRRRAWEYSHSVAVEARRLRSFASVASIEANDAAAAIAAVARPLWSGSSRTSTPEMD